MENARLFTVRFYFFFVEFRVYIQRIVGLYTFFYIFYAKNLTSILRINSKLNCSYILILTNI